MQESPARVVVSRLHDLDQAASLQGLDGAIKGDALGPGEEGLGAGEAPQELGPKLAAVYLGGRCVAVVHCQQDDFW